MQDLEPQILMAAATGAATVAVVAGILTAWALYRPKRERVARDEILNYLKANGFTMMSFTRIRARLNPGYTDEFLRRLPDYFPNELRRAVLRDTQSGELNIPGLARVITEPGDVIREAPSDA